MKCRPKTRKKSLGWRFRLQAGRLRPRQFLLTRNEAAFLRVLITVLGDRYLISCKVRLADIISCSSRDWRRGHGNRVAQKHVDFVVTCPNSSRIVAVIELDDASHDRPERRRRDAFVNGIFRKLRLRLIRIPAQWNYDVESTTRRLAAAGFPVRAS